MQEFSVQTNAVSAEFGRLGGGVINLITKSGTQRVSRDRVRVRPEQQAGRDQLLHQPRRAAPGQLQAQPVRRQRRRSADAARLQGATGRSSSSTTRACGRNRARSRRSPCRCRSGAAATFRTCATRTASRSSSTTRRRPGPIRAIRARSSATRSPATSFRSERISAVGRALAQYWPLPNTTPSNAFTQASNYVLSGAQPSNGDRIDSRVDHVVSDKWRTFVRYSLLGRRQPGVQQLPERGQLVGRRRPDLHDDAEPVDRQQLRAVTRRCCSTCATD